MKYIKVTRLELQTPLGEVVGTTRPKDLWWNFSGVKGSPIDIKVTGKAGDATRLAIFNRGKCLVTCGLHEFAYPRSFLTKGEILRLKPLPKEENYDEK